jgi:hypothetical protein
MKGREQQLIALYAEVSMSLRSILGDVVKVGGIVAPEVVTALNPAAGAITQLVLNGIIKAEQSGGDSASKKQQVVNAVLPSVAPTLNTVLPTAGGAANIDSQGVHDAVGQMVDAFVKLLNSVQVPAAAAAAASPAAKPPGGS